VAVVGVLAVALWVTVGIRALTSHHGTNPPQPAAIATGQASGQGSGGSADVVSPHLLGSLSASSGVAALAFTPDGRTLVVRLQTGGVQIRDAATGALRATVRLPGYASDGGQGSLAISPDGTTMATSVYTGAASSPVDLISLATGKVTASFPVGSSLVDSVAFSPDGKTLAIAAYKNLILLNLTTRTSVNVTTSDGGFQGDSRYVSFSANGRYLADANNQGLVKLWDVRSTGFAKSWTIPSAAGGGSQDGNLINAAGFSPDSSMVAVSGSISGSASDVPGTWFWNPSTGKVRQLQPAPGSASAGDAIEAQAFSPDARLLATGDESGAISLWDTATGKLLATEHAPSSIGTVTAMTFAPGGNSLVTAQTTSETLGASGVSTAVLQLWGVHPGPAGQAPPAGPGGWAAPAGGSAPAGQALRPGVYPVGKTMGLTGSYVIKLQSVQVAASGQVTFVVAIQNAGTVPAPLSCDGAHGATIMLSTGQVINSTDIYCPSGPQQGGEVDVAPQGTLVTWTIFNSSDGLGLPFSFNWGGPDGFGGALSGVHLSS
jgi:WD40 repeat protein